MTACCAPGSGSPSESSGPASAPAKGGPGAPLTLPFTPPVRDPRDVRRGMVRIPGGPFLMGGDDPEAVPGDGEGPVRTVEVSPFLIDATAVTNRQFAAFVKATSYVTEAERFGWSYVFHLFVGDRQRPHVMDAVVPETPWWLAVEGADWRHPEGPGSDITTRPQHPVVQVSWNDAAAYAAWAGKRLPTEAEWERAARGGLEHAKYSWGDELLPKNRWRCNIWQGTFPTRNTEDDGHLGTAPVKSYPPNGFGLYEVTGNVWEWCADWWSPDWHREERDETRRDPLGPPHGETRVMRGGSYLCHDSYCTRYRVAARTANSPDSSTGNLGFRCAADLAG